MSDYFSKRHLLNKLLNNFGNTILWRVFFWLILLVLLFLTLTPAPPNPIQLNGVDKLYHLIAFTAFSFAFKMAYGKTKMLIILSSSVLLGIAIEVAQYHIPNRGFSFADMLADAVGVLVGFGLAKILRGYLNN